MAEIHEVIETLDDLKDEYAQIDLDSGKDEEVKKKERDEYFKRSNTKKLLGFLNSKLSNDKCFLIGSTPTIADLIFFVSFEYMIACYPTIGDEYPLLLQL